MASEAHRPIRCRADACADTQTTYQPGQSSGRQITFVVQLASAVYRQNARGDDPSAMSLGDATALALADVLIFSGAFIGIFGSSGMRQLGMPPNAAE